MNHSHTAWISSGGPANRVHPSIPWEHRTRFGGVAPICRVLSQHGVSIAPRTYYSAKAWSPKAIGASSARPGDG